MKTLIAYSIVLIFLLFCTAAIAQSKGWLIAFSMVFGSIAIAFILSWAILVITKDY